MIAIDESRVTHAMRRQRIAKEMVKEARKNAQARRHDT